MKDNKKNGLKMLVTFIVIIACCISVIKDIQYQGINVKYISLFVLMVASIYFGVLFERSKYKGEEKIRSEEANVPTHKEAYNSNKNIPEEFRDEERRFQQLNEKGMLK